MENQRFLFFFTLFFITYLLWAQWQIDYGPAPVENTITGTQQSLPAVGDSSEELPVAAVAGNDTTAAISEITASNKQSELSESKRITITTDVFEIELNTKGGDIRKIKLLNYSVEANKPKDKFMLLNDDNDTLYHIAQSGIVSKQKESSPTHNAIYSTAETNYYLEKGDTKIKVPLVWRSDDGTEIVKTYTFHRGKYDVDVNYKVTAGNQDWSGSQYMQLVRTRPSGEGESVFIHTYTGGVIYNEELKYEKYDFDDMDDEKLKMNLDDGWLAMIQHYFLVAWVPEQGNKNLYYSSQPSGTYKYILGARGPAKKIVQGQTAEFNSTFVAGPKIQGQLDEIAPGLELTVDYGILTIFAKPLFSLLAIFHDWTNNWGWAIILLTLSVKAVFYKLSEMSYKSMAKMRKVAPRMKAMKERFGDDRAAMSKAMMDMYKKEKINPMGGCFPILVQMPVFISLYWVLLESVEMRHAPFILWLDNLSAMDPYFILPVIMGVTMFVQQKLNPAPVDPIQAKVFQIMPFAFTIMFAFFPSGLVLYWVVNNMLSITQQYIITKRIENS